jgi:hypothetical protein
LEAGRIAASSVDFCLECHRADEQGITHPLKVRPGDRFRGIAVPPDYCLSNDGKIICLTCHTAHGPGRSAIKAHASQRPDDPGSPPGSPPSYKTYFLRRPDPVSLGYGSLCLGCHKAP